MNTPPPNEFDRVAVAEGYDRWSAIYDGEDNALIHVEDAHLPGVLGEVLGLRVLDAGCGTGRLALRLAASGARVTACDFSAGMLARLREKPGAEGIATIEHDLSRALPMADGSFERVLCGLVLEHLDNLAAVFGEFRRVLQPGGAVIVSTLHPAMMLRGISARFTDPATGRETRPRSCDHSISDYVMAALAAGLRIEHMSEHVVDEATAERSPRARKYLGWPILLLMRLGRGG